MKNLASPKRSDKKRGGGVNSISIPMMEFPPSPLPRPLASPSAPKLPPIKESGKKSLNTPNPGLGASREELPSRLPPEAPASNVAKRGLLRQTMHIFPSQSDFPQLQDPGSDSSSEETSQQYQQQQQQQPQHHNHHDFISKRRMSLSFRRHEDRLMVRFDQQGSFAYQRMSFIDLFNIYSRTLHSAMQAALAPPNGPSASRQALTATIWHRKQRGKFGALHFRDLHRLDPDGSYSSESCILVRKCAILLNLDQLKALILPTECYVVLGVGVDSLLEILRYFVSASHPSSFVLPSRPSSPDVSDLLHSNLNHRINTDDKTNQREKNVITSAKPSLPSMPSSSSSSSGSGSGSPSSASTLVDHPASQRPQSLQSQTQKSSHLPPPSSASAASPHPVRHLAVPISFHPSLDCSSDSDSDGHPDGHPFELFALEALLETLCGIENHPNPETSEDPNYSILGQEHAILRAEVRRIDREQLAATRLEELRQISMEASKFKRKVLAMRRALKELLENDAGMAFMQLSKVCRNPDLYQEENQNQWGWDHEDVEVILAAYFENIVSFRAKGKVQSSMIKVKHGEMVLALDAGRNRLLRIDLYFSVITAMAGIGALAAGIFGMNLNSHIQDDDGWFWTIAAVFSIGPALFGIIFLYTAERRSWLLA